jgi:hypothetical protein
VLAAPEKLEENDGRYIASMTDMLIFGVHDVMLLLDSTHSSEGEALGENEGHCFIHIHIASLRVVLPSF